MSKVPVDQFGRMKLDWRLFREMILEKFSVKYGGSDTLAAMGVTSSDTLNDLMMPTEGNIN